VIKLKNGKSLKLSCSKLY